MTPETITTREEFLRALSEHPDWKEAVRAQILTEELLLLPVQFQAFVKRFDAFETSVNERFDAFETGVNERFDQVHARFDRIEGDISASKGGHARTQIILKPDIVALELDLEYIRTLSATELNRMALNANDSISRDQRRSFWHADLVIETNGNTDTHYLAVEISYTADQRDINRARRNAEYLRSFTGQNATAVVASVRNDHDAQQAIDYGEVTWYPIERRDLSPA